MEELQQELIYPKFNHFQTQLSPTVIAQYPKEVIDDLLQYWNDVPFIQRLTALDRPYAKDRPRDESGRIIVDLSNPHILTDMDYFRPAAKHWEEHGCYTKLKVNMHPQSEWMKWFKQEVERCWEGMVRPEDGEWITGDMYFFLNYNIMTQTTIRTNKAGKQYGAREEKLPECWEGIYWRFHYLDQARYGGLYNQMGGVHAAEIASRGKGKSYTLASMLERLFTVGIGKGLESNRKGLIVADLKTYLIDDGTLNKFETGLTHLAKHTQFPQHKERDSLTNMTWLCGWTDTDGNQMGPNNLVIGQAIGDDADKSRGKRSDIMLAEEFGKFGKFSNWWATSMPNVQEGEVVFGLGYSVGTGGTEGCLTPGNKVITKSGLQKNVEDLVIGDGIIGYDVNSKSLLPQDITFLGRSTKYCIELYTNTGKRIECTTNHPIYASNKIDCNARRVYDWIEAGSLNIGDLITVPLSVPLFGSNFLEDPRGVGLLIGDGSYGNNQNVRIHSCDVEILDYFKNTYNCTVQSGHITKDNKQYECLTIKGGREWLRRVGIYGQTKNKKRLPTNWSSLVKKDLALLLSGLFDTDGNISNTYIPGRDTYKSVVSMSSSCKGLLLEVSDALQRFGIHTNILCKKSHKYSKSVERTNSVFYSLEVSDRDSIINFANNIPLLIGYKVLSLNRAKEIALSKKSLRRNKEFYYEKIVSKSLPHVKEIINLSTSNGTYLANGIITHNSDFTGALDMIYSPESSHIYGLPNVYDRGSNGMKKTVFFFPAFINYKPFYNNDGVSDVIGAMLSELMQRYDIKYTSQDPLKITRRKAEYAFTIQDAIMRRGGTVYPVADINDRVLQLDTDSTATKDMYVGRIDLTSGKPLWRPDADLKPIVSFPHKDNKLEGCIFIKAMPEKSSDQDFPKWGRYVAGCDPYDDDESETKSLFAGYIIDLWTDDIVAEYVGRPQFADEAYENWRRLLMFYNAECNYENNKKGIFKYFSQHNCLYLLADTLEFLKDKDMAKLSYGNKAKGTLATVPVKNYSRRCIRDYLLKPFESTSIVDGEEVIQNVANLFRIKFKALLLELSMWNIDGNFDRHDALAMAMLIREDKLRLLGDTSFSSKDNQGDSLADDPFFNDNYKKDKREGWIEQMKKLHLMPDTN